MMQPAVVSHLEQSALRSEKAIIPHVRAGCYIVDRLDSRSLILSAECWCEKHGESVTSIAHMR